MTMAVEWKQLIVNNRFLLVIQWNLLLLKSMDLIPIAFTNLNQTLPFLLLHIPLLPSCHSTISHHPTPLHSIPGQAFCETISSMLVTTFPHIISSTLVAFIPHICYLKQTVSVERINFGRSKIWSTEAGKQQLTKSEKLNNERGMEAITADTRTNQKEAQGSWW